MTTAAVRGRHVAGRPVAELLEQAAEHEWDTSLLSVHARLHRPWVPVQRLPSRWTWTGDLYAADEAEPPTLVRAYVPVVETERPEPQEPNTLTELWFGQRKTAC